MLGTPERPGKRELYLQAGAQEFWLCDETGRMSFHAATGPMSKSLLWPGFPDQI